MLNRSDRFDTMIRYGGQVISRADVLVGGQPVLTNVEISAGSVQMDRGQFCRRTCDVTIADSSLIPADASDPLQPWGSELRLFRGVLMPDGTEEVLPVGTFVIWSVEYDDPFGGLKITGYDRCKLIQQARFPYARNMPAGLLVSRLSTLALEAVPWSSFNTDSAINSGIIAGAVTYDRDRDQACSEIATSLGAEFFADPWGEFALRPIPDPNGDVNWWISADDILVGATRQSTRDGVYNAVIATSTTTGIDAPPSALVTDDDPYSPTYYGGTSLLTGNNFGAAPYFFDSPLLTTTDQCRQAAAGILRDVIGLQQTVTISSVVQPALEPGDILGIKFPDGTSQHHLAESWTLDLGPTASMSITTRSTNYQLASA